MTDLLTLFRLWALHSKAYYQDPMMTFNPDGMGGIRAIKAGESAPSYIMHFGSVENAISILRDGLEQMGVEID